MLSCASSSGKRLAAGGRAGVDCLYMNVSRAFYGFACTLIGGFALLMSADTFASSRYGAAPAAGPLDGKAVHSLRPLATPGFAGSSPVEGHDLIDWAYGDTLQAEGDWTTLLGWYQDIKHKAVDDDVRARAEAGVVEAYEKLENIQGLREIYPEMLAAMAADDPARVPLMVKMIPVMDGDERETLLQALIPYAVQGDARAEWGIVNALRARALETGDFGETYGLPAAEFLVAHHAANREMRLARERTVAQLNIIPGLGQIYAGDWRGGVGSLAVFAFLIVMVSGTSNRRQWGSAVFWWMVLGFVMVSSPTLGG
ncbi:MAG: hypothetical protein COY40_02425 [Alphaproteobacteria bacterium CG_4_10_14_0_8_um_filter_53_9]|nr:MAG: hypothetical protein COY40_02425 [Alphaproteobacteria bacterium CG_4_10_14_0_8_um_filter_53_9]